MKLNLMLTADYAMISREGKLSILGIFTNINTIDFPAKVSIIYLVTILEPELGEYGQIRELTIQLHAPDGQMLFSITSPLNIPQPKEGRCQINSVIDLHDVIFPIPGPYRFVAIVDKDHKGSTSLAVNKFEPPPSPQAPK